MTAAAREILKMDGVVRPRSDGSGIAEALLPSPCVQNHAANLMTLANGDLACVWFGGTQEGKSDISVYMSRLPAGSGTWAAPQKLSADATRSEQNPILFPAPDGTLWLLHTSQRAGNQDTAVVKRRVSRDGGVTWGPSDVVFDTPGTFARQPMVVLANGDWLLPCWDCKIRPGSKWLGDLDTSFVKVSSDAGKTWRDVVVPESTGLVHMNILPTPRGDLVALYRSRWADNIYQSRSRDGGASWSAPVATRLPNNNSSIQATALADGRIALVFNNSARTASTEQRASLYDEIEDEGDTAPVAPSAPLAANAATPAVRQAFWGTPRAPVTLALSDDGGLTWRIVGDLETGDGYCLTNNSEQRLNRELSYPTVTPAQDGGLHVAFTYHRQAIKYLKLPRDVLRRADQI